jgi:hypothetical protein
MSDIKDALERSVRHDGVSCSMYKDRRRRDELCLIIYHMNFEISIF